MESTFVYRNSDGVKRTLITDTERPGKVVVHTEQNMDEIFESIKEAKEVQAMSKGAFKHLARVPIAVYEKSIVEQWGDDDWKKWLNDPDNAALRVWTGQV